MPIIDLMEKLTDWFAAEIGYYKKIPKNGEWNWIKNKWSLKPQIDEHISDNMLLTAMLCDLGYDDEVGAMPSIVDAKQTLHDVQYNMFEWFYNSYCTQ
eukprot:UN10967